nr:recombinase family protein [Burkholderia cenocepacia]
MRRTRNTTTSLSGVAAASIPLPSISCSRISGSQRSSSDRQDGLRLTLTLDRLGRNAMDVRSTVEALSGLGVKVHCLALGGVDLTSAAGKMTMQVLNAVAEFERDLLIERTNAGIQRARTEGKQFGRPSALTAEQQAEVAERLAKGEAVAALARDFKTSRQTIMRLREKAAAGA